MKRILFLILFSLCFTVSCNNNSGSGRGDSLSEEDVKKEDDVVTKDTQSKEKLNLYGDSEFVSVSNKILSGEKVSSGNNYYISANAASEGNGSQTSPFKTFKNALSKLSAGDTLYVMAGTYYEQIKLTSKQKGSAVSYITIAAAESNIPPIISGQKASNNFILMTINGASFVRISGLTFKDSNGLDAAGIYIEPPSNHIIIDNCSFTNIKVPDPATRDHVANGILCFGERADASINNLLFYKNSFTDMATGWGECVSVVANCEFVNIIKNIIDKTGNIGIDVGGNYGYCSKPSVDFARYVYIAENTVKNCESAYGDTAYGIYADGGQHIQIINNTVEHCSGGIEVGAEEPQKSEAYATLDVLVQKNKVSFSDECALAIGGYDKDLGLVRSVKVIQNVFTDNADKDDGAIIALSKCDKVIIQENNFTQSNGKYKGEVLYKALDGKYTTNLTINNNTYKGLDSADE